MRLELIAQLPSSPSQSTPLLFVQWHAAWCWEHFLPWFAARGHAAYALSLRGHGASDGRAGQRWHRVAEQMTDTVPTMVLAARGDRLFSVAARRHTA